MKILEIFGTADFLVRKISIKESTNLSQKIPPAFGMYVCVCVCSYVCVFVCLFVCMYVRMYVLFRTETCLALQKCFKTLMA
jgi:ABC-type uncharacterized transport system permease subunit